MNNNDSKLKFLPLLITLIAASITAAINLIMHVEIAVFLKRLFFCIIIFYILGYIVYIIMNLALKNEKDVGILESEAEEAPEEPDSDEAKTEDDE
ncbi:MAG: hypothetical protein K5675_02340 [Lachnospiraceae bacterium]|nr:hypothetical protein [Lachnospiraceae bacterium]